MSNPVIEALLPSLAQHEGSFLFLFLDTAGLVTCGLGHMVPNLAASQALPWQPDDPATIASDFAIVAGMPKGKVAVFYEEATVCRLPANWPEQDAAQRLETEFLPPLRALFAGGNYMGKLAFDAFPLPAQVVLLDMSYNLGIGRARTATHPASGLCEYALMLTACSRGDWATAAKECSRRGISAARNAWTAAQFQSATNPGAQLLTETAGK